MKEEPKIQEYIDIDKYLDGAYRVEVNKLTQKYKKDFSRMREIEKDIEDWVWDAFKIKKTSYNHAVVYFEDIKKNSTITIDIWDNSSFEDMIYVKIYIPVKYLLKKLSNRQIKKFIDYNFYTDKYDD